MRHPHVQCVGAYTLICMKIHINLPIPVEIVSLFTVQKVYEKQLRLYLKKAAGCCTVQQHHFPLLRLSHHNVLSRYLTQAVIDVYI